MLLRGFELSADSHDAFYILEMRLVQVYEDFKID